MQVNAAPIPVGENSIPVRDSGDERFLMLAETLSGSVLLRLDCNGRIRRSSAAAHTMYGYAGEELLGQSLGFLSSNGANAAELPEILTRAVAAGKSQSAEGHRRKDGSTVWVDVVVTAMRNEEQGVIDF